MYVHCHALSAFCSSLPFTESVLLRPLFSILSLPEQKRRRPVRVRRKVASLRKSPPVASFIDTEHGLRKSILAPFDGIAVRRRMCDQHPRARPRRRRGFATSVLVFARDRRRPQLLELVGSLVVRPSLPTTPVFRVGFARSREPISSAE